MSAINYYVCDEMQKVRNWLDEHNIVWKDTSTHSKDSDFWICRTRVNLSNHTYSIIHGFETMGGFSHWQDDDEGKLEMMTIHDPTIFSDDEVQGYLSSKDVIKWISKRHNIKG